ncbi:MAG: phosphonate C-P lyase system protein PhnG [Hyphomicrobiales bacterium]
MEQDQTYRQALLGTLAQSDMPAILECWKTLNINPECELIRGPETGLIALRGRMGGGGAVFNFGEATVTRATVKLSNGSIGHAAALGRDTGKVKLSAIIDAVAQDNAMKTEITSKIIEPLVEKITSRDTRRAGETAATKVDFFTLVRGDTDA